MMLVNIHSKELMLRLKTKKRGLDQKYTKLSHLKIVKNMAYENGCNQYFNDMRTLDFDSFVVLMT